MERIDHHGAREHGNDAAAARIVRAAALRLALACGIASFTAALSLAALAARTEAVALAPPATRVAPIVRDAAETAVTTAASRAAPAVGATRTDI